MLGDQEKQPIDIALSECIQKWSTLRQTREVNPLETAYWNADNKALEVLLKQAQAPELPLSEREEMLAVIQEILQRHAPREALLQAETALNQHPEDFLHPALNREGIIAIGKANIQASQVIVQGMNFIREHATILSHHPHIIESIRLSEYAVIQGREHLKRATPEALKAALTNVKGAILIHHLMISRAEKWKTTLGDSVEPNILLDEVKQAAADNMLREALGDGSKGLLKTIESLEAQLETIEDLTLKRYLQEKCLALLHQFQDKHSHCQEAAL